MSQSAPRLVSEPDIEPFSPRRVGWHGVRNVAGYRLKVYSIAYQGRPTVMELADDLWPRVGGVLPQPAHDAARPGVGFIILHCGRDMCYFVAAWWDNENELPLRVWVRSRGAEDGWRPARGSESICIYDLEIISHERDAYVETIMNGSPDASAYLARRLPRAGERISEGS